MNANPSLAPTAAVPPATVSLLGTPLLVTDYAGLLDLLPRLAARPEPSAIDFSNTQIVTMRRVDRAFRETTDVYDYFVPDGMPLVWCLRAMGARLRDRVYGPAFMRYALMRETKLRHYFLGGSEETSRRLVEQARLLSEGRFQVVGANHRYHGPEDAGAILEEIERLSPDVVWIAFGAPKQQQWVRANKGRLSRGVLLTVGFAFDVNAGTKRDAPMWMQRLGLTWAFRLSQEPGRLAGRYLKYNTLFLAFVALDAARALFRSGRGRRGLFFFMKVLLVELWGLGDAVLMTTALRPLLEAGAAVTVLGKPSTIELLRPSYPAADFIPFTAPWTVFRGKYRLWAWPWRELARVARQCRGARFDAAASVRSDPRDDLLMFLCGARRRIGFPRRGMGIFLNRRLAVSPTAHRVDLWREIGAAIPAGGTGGEATAESRPFLRVEAYGTRPERREARPVLGLHCGAQQAVRRWDEESFAAVVRRLRGEGDFHLALFPDTDGYGRALLPLADSCHEGLSIPGLVAALAGCDGLICNDSGPGHIAAALGKPVLAIFGPGDPYRFAPYGEKNHMVIRDICPFRPCHDHCRFPEPICLRQLRPEEVWPEIRDWFRRQLDSRASPRLS